MTAQPEPYISEEAYLEFERARTIKHEYFEGRIYAMTGAKEAHNLIAANTLASLHSRLSVSDRTITLQRVSVPS